MKEKKKEQEILFQTGKFISGQRQEKSNWSFILLLSYLCGVCGILYTFPFFQNVTCDKAQVYGIGILVSLFLWFGQNQKGWKVGLSFTVLLLIWIYVQRNQIFLQGKQIIDALSVTGDLSQSQDFTQSLCLFAIFLSVFLFLLVWKLGMGWIFYLYSLPLIFAGPWIGIHLDEKGLILLLLFHMGSSISGKMMFDRKRIYARFFQKYQRKTAGSALCLLSLLFLISFLIIYKFPDPYVGKFLNLSQTIQNRARKQTMNIFGIKEDMGSINRGNQYADDEEKLEVVFPKKPEHTLYLKNYTGRTYNENGRWEEADERDFYKTYEEQNGDVVGQNLFENQAIYLAEYNKQELSVIRSITMDLKEKGSKTSSHYIPYMEGYIGSTNKREQTVLYKKKDILKELRNYDYETRQIMDRMINQEEEYQMYRRLHYLNASHQRFPRLTKLCREYSLEDEKDITNFIKKELKQRASYTLTPGTMPLNKEIPEYFLFEGKKGYCQHFATTAALMYRMYDIPSRYAAGYRADVKDFKQQSDGTWKAVLSEDDAHAWVEIYDDLWGWKPIEVTPSASLYEKQGNYQDKQPTTEEQPDFSNQTQGTDEKQKTQSFILPVIRRILWILLVLFLAPMPFCILWFFRKQKLHDLKDASADRLFAQLKKMLKSADMMSGYVGNEVYFTKELVKYLPVIKKEEAENMMELVLKESFGGMILKKEEQQEVFEIYQKAANFLTGQMKFYQKWYVMYWKVYI